MVVQEKINKINSLFSGEKDYIGVDYNQAKEKIIVYVSSRYFSMEIEEVMKKIDVDVYCGRRMAMSY